MRLALAAGHRNRDGGNTYEQTTTALLTRELFNQARGRHIDVRCITPDNGTGTYPGGLQAVARQVVTWAEQGWVADVFLEPHTEGVAVPGVFCIYPDWGDDVDADVRDTLGPDIARRVSQATGLRLRPVLGEATSGVMSERRTGVGASGSRLGIFHVTEPLALTTTRLIVEYGSHAHAVEMRLHRDPMVITAAATATLTALQHWMGETTPVDENDAALERLWLLERQRLGEKRTPGAGTYAREWAGEKILFCQRGVLAAKDGTAFDITERVLDDWATWAGPEPHGNGDLVLYG